MKLFKYSLILALGMFSSAVMAEANESVQASYVVSMEQEQDIKIFMENKHFNDCANKDASLHLQYAFGSIVLASKLKDNQCVVTLTKEVEQGTENSEDCSLDAISTIDWIRDSKGQISLMPPSCQGVALSNSFVVNQNANPNELSDFFNTIDAAQCQTDDVVVEYDEQTLKIKFTKKEKTCDASVSDFNTDEEIQLCSLTQLQQIAWFYNQQGFILSQAPDFNDCGFQKVDVVDVIAAPVAQDKPARHQPVRDWLSFMFNMLFGRFFGGAA